MFWTLEIPFKTGFTVLIVSWKVEELASQEFFEALKKRFVSYIMNRSKRLRSVITEPAHKINLFKVCHISCCLSFCRKTVWSKQLENMFHASL
jgi:hypothetical protein